MLAAGHHHGQSGLGLVSAGRVRRSAEGGAMSAQQRVGAAADLSPGKVVGAGRYAVGNAGAPYFAVPPPSPHLRAALAAATTAQNPCPARPPPPPAPPPRTRPTDP